MGLFKKKPDDYQSTLENINKENEQLSAERIIYMQVNDDDDNSAFLVDQMKAGHPLVIDFDLLSVAEANKLVAFFCGATYAVNGTSQRLFEKVFIFARNIDFLDGSLEKFIKEQHELRRF